VSEFYFRKLLRDGENANLAGGGGGVYDFGQKYCPQSKKREEINPYNSFSLKFILALFQKLLFNIKHI
jgi:hypothetical protein